MTKLQELIEEREKGWENAYASFLEKKLPEQKVHDSMIIAIEFFEEYIRETIQQTLELVEGCVGKEEKMLPIQGDELQTRLTNSARLGMNLKREEVLSNIKALKV